MLEPLATDGNSVLLIATYKYRVLINYFVTTSQKLNL